MKTALFAIMLLLAAAMPGHISRAAQEDTEFRACYTMFLDAMRRNDKQALADLIAFPVDWAVERNGDVQTEQIKDGAEFVARYAVLVTPFMRSHVARGKVSKLTDGRYVVMWRDAGAEFSFEFGRAGRGGYLVRSYAINPD